MRFIIPIPINDLRLFRPDLIPDRWRMMCHNNFQPPNFAKVDQSMQLLGEAILLRNCIRSMVVRGVSKHEPPIGVTIWGKKYGWHLESSVLKPRIEGRFVSNRGFIEWREIHDVGDCIIVLLCYPFIVFSLLRKKYSWCSWKIISFNHFDELLFKRAPPKSCKGLFNVNIPMKVNKMADKLPERVVVAPPFFGQWFESAKISQEIWGNSFGGKVL